MIDLTYVMWYIAGFFSCILFACYASGGGHDWIGIAMCGFLWRCGLSSYCPTSEWNIGHVRLI